MLQEGGAHHPWTQIIGIAFLIAFLGLLLFNGALMICSPRRWFDLPAHIGLQGPVRHQRRQFLQSFWSRFQIRLMGFGCLTVIGWMFFAIVRGPVGAATPTSPTDHVSNVSPDLLNLGVGLLFLVAGLRLWFKPGWRWRARNVDPTLPLVEPAPTIRRISQVSGFMLSMVACWFVFRAVWALLVRS